MESISEKTGFFSRLCSGSLLVFGTTVGAGMLGIPLVTARAGFGPAAVVTAVVWLFMTITGLLLLEVSLRMPRGANLISLSRRFLGGKGVFVSALLFLFLYDCLLVAYFAGGAPLLGEGISLLGISLPWLGSLFLFSLAFGWIVFLGPRLIDRVNKVLAGGMLCIYFVLIFLGTRGVQMQKLTEVSDFSLSLLAVPILFGAFGYHNVIPSLTTYLDKQKKVLQASIILGTFLAFLFYLIWQWMILGSVSAESLQETLAKGLPVTYALQSSCQGSSLYFFGQLFAFLALTTSFLGVSFSLVDFIRDGFQQSGVVASRLLCTVVALLPPFLCVLLNPSVFDQALGIAGGFGETILNGFLPVLLFISMKRLLELPPLSCKQKFGLFLLAFFSLFVFACEVYFLSVHQR